MQLYNHEVLGRTFSKYVFVQMMLQSYCHMQSIVWNSDFWLDSTITYHYHMEP